MNKQLKGMGISDAFGEGYIHRFQPETNHKIH